MAEQPVFPLWLLAFTILWRLFWGLAYPTSAAAAAGPAVGVVGRQGTSPARTPLRTESRATPFAQNMAMVSGARRRIVATTEVMGTCSPDATYGNALQGIGAGTGAGSLRRTPLSGGGRDIGDRARARTRGSPFASPPAPKREQDVAAYVGKRAGFHNPGRSCTAAAGAAVGTHGYNNYLINPYSAPTVDQDDALAVTPTRRRR